MIRRKRMKSFFMFLMVVLILFCILLEVNALRRKIAPEAVTLDEKFIVYLENKIGGEK